MQPIEVEWYKQNTMEWNVPKRDSNGKWIVSWWSQLGFIGEVETAEHGEPEPESVNWEC